MALKFRRGTTAQKSGSLAFGEPFVNTDLGTLQIGLESGDVTLSSIGTGSNLDVAGISGSSLDITGNAKIDGNLTLGGNITIGNNTSDNVVVNADLSSSIIPNDDEAFDLGSASKRYRVIYGTNIYGTINATNGVVSGSSQVIGILDSLNTFSGSAISRLSALETETANLESFTSSINTTIKSKLDADGVVSGSSQITLSSTTGFSAYSTSVDSRIATEKGRVDAILLSADADKDSFAEIVTLINSVDTTNDTAFASFYTASVGRLNNLESTSASVNISVSNLNSFTSSINTTIKSKLDADGVISGSSQISLSGFSTTNLSEGSNLYYTDARVKAKLNTETVVSGSSQVIGILSSLNTYTGSNDTTNTTQNSRLDQLSTASGSAISRLSALETETANLEAFTSSINTTIKSKLDADGVISSSAQLTTTFDSRYLNTGGDGVVSGSSQISHDSTTGYSANRHIDHTAVSITAGSGLTGGGDISATRTLSIATGGVTNGMLANSTISGIALGSNLSTLTIGTGLSGTSYNGSGAVTIANTGVTSAVAGTGVGVSAGTGAVTISIGQSVATTATPTFGNLTINGTITATGDITAYFTSDRRHKNNIQIIPNALSKVTKLNGVTWEWNDDVNEVTKSTPKTGLIAQEVQAVLPEVVVERENGYLGLDYSKMMGLLVEAIKEQQIKIDNLTIEVERLTKQKGL